MVWSSCHAGCLTSFMYPANLRTTPAGGYENCIMWVYIPAVLSSKVYLAAASSWQVSFFLEEIEVYSPIIMAILAILLPLLSGALTAYAQTCTTVQPVFELPLDATSTAYASTITTTSSVDCDGCSLEVTTFRAIISGSTVSHDLEHTYLLRLTNCS